MNKFYKVVFCKATGVMKAVSETAKSGKKTKSVSVAAGVLAAGVMFSTAAMAAVNDPVLSGETTGNAIAVGQTNTVDGANSTAVGHDNEVVGDDHTILGSNNNAGNFDNSYYDYDTDEWVDSVENFNNNTIVGNQNETRGNNSIAVGISNRVENNQVTVTGGDNHVDTENSGAYGQYNKVGTSNVAPQFFRVDDGSESGRQMRRYGLQEGGSYAYGNANEAIGNQNHVVGNDNRLGADTSGVLGNGNNLRNEYFEEPSRRDLNEYSQLRSNGSFLVGNDNYVDGNNTHAVGNANEINAERNVTIGNANTVNVNNGNNYFDQEKRRPSGFPLDPNQNTSTAIVGEANSLNAAGVHIVGTENDVDQAYSYVVGGGNTVESGDNGFLPFDENNTTNGSNLLGSDNYIESNSASVLGNSNRVGYNSPMTTVAGSQNFTDGISTSTVGTANSIEKDVGGAHGTLNRVAGNYGIISAIEDALRSEVFEGIDLDGDGIIDVTDPEQAMQIVLESGSYAFGNINNLKGEGAHAVGNNNEFSGNSNKGIGNKNRIGRVGGQVGDSDAVLPTVVFNDSAAYGDNNVIDGNSSQSVGNENRIASDRTSVVGYDNEVDSNNGQVVGNTNIVDGNSASLVGSDNTVIGQGNGVLGDSNKLGVPPERYGDGDNQFYVAAPVSDSYAVGKENTILGNDSHTIGNGNKSESQTIFIAGTNNNVNSHDSSVTGHNNRVVKTDEEGENRYNSDVSVSGNYNSVQESNVFVGGNSNTVAAYGGGAVGNYNTVGQEGGRYYEYYDEMRETTGSYALGNQNSVYGSNSFSVGTNNLVDGDNSHVLGAENSQQADLSTVVGSYNYAGEKAFGSIIVSQGSNVHGAGAISVGIINNISKDKSGAFGALNTITGTPEFADYMKNEDMAGMQYQFTTGSYATGNLNNLEGDSSHIVGNSNTVNGKKTNVVGNSNEVTANDSFIGGNDNTVEADDVLVLGNNNTLGAGTDGSIILGSNASSTVAGGIAIGNNSVVDRANSVSVGSVGAERQITNVADATDDYDAVNLKQLKAKITDTTAGKNIAVKRTDTGYEVSTVEDMTLTSVTTGDTILNNAGLTNGATTVGATGLKVGDVTVSNVGLDNAGNRVTSVGDATLRSDAVNYGQFTDGLAGTIKSVTGDENVVATTDAEKNVILNLNKDLNVDRVTTGNTSFNTDGVRAGDVFLSSTTGLDNAGNRVTSVGDAIIRSDAVNYGQFTDGLANTIKSVTGDENITATTDEDKNVVVTLNKDLVADSLTAGTTIVNTDGVRAGDVFLSNTGLDNGGNRVTNVGNAVEDSDAVNFGQFKAGITDTTAGKNITVKRTDTGYEVATVEDMTLTSVTTGNTVINNAGFTNGATTVGNTGLKVGDVTVSNVGLDNAGNRVTSVGDATLRSDAVNYGQFTDGMANTIKSVTGDENVVATTDAEKNVSLVLNRDLNVDSVTVGTNVFDSSGLKVGNVSIGDEVGIYAGNMTVSGVADAVNADDAVNLGQVNAVDDRLTNENIAQNTNITNNTNAINQGFNVGNGVTSNKFDLGDTVDITAGKNAKVTTTDTGVEVSVADDLVVTSVTAGTSSFNTDGFRAGDVLVGNTGINNAGFRVSGVGDAINRDDAVNYGQFQDGLNGIKKTTIDGDTNIIATSNETGYDLSLGADLTADSLTTGNTVVNTDGLKVGDVTVSSGGLNNAGNRVTNVGDAIEDADAVNFKQFKAGMTDTTASGNLTATRTETGYDVAMNDTISLVGVNTGSTSMTTDGVRAGDVFLSSSNGLYNAGNKVTGVGDATERDDAVNYGQFQDGLNGLTKTTVDGDANITATKNATGYDVTLNQDVTLSSVTTGVTSIDNSGLKVGDVTVSSAGLDNAGNRVTSVGDAIIRSDAVNYGQFTDGMANTIKSVTGDENIIATTDAERNVILNLKKDIVVDSMTAGNTLINNNGMTIGDSFFGATGVRTGDVILSSTSGLYNGGYRVTGVDRAVEGTDAVNFDQFNEALNNIAPTNIKGDANITVTNTGAGYDIGLNKDLTADSVTTGGTTVSNAGLTTGDVTVSNSGLSNGGNRVTNIGDAVEGSDAVSFDQFNKKFDDMIPTDIKGDSNITVTKTDTGFDLNLNKDLTADSVTVGNTSITNDGLKVGDVSITAGGLNNGGNTVKGVGDGVLRDDAVNKGQLDDLEVRQNIKNEAQDVIINNKLDRDEFLKDQERQDALLEGKADKAELDKTNVNVSNNTTNISKNSDTLKDHEKELGRLEDVKADKAELDKTNIKVQDNADKNKEQDKVLGDHKTELDRLEDVKADKSDLEAKADKTYVDKEITATNDRFSEINKENNAKFDKFEKSQNTIDSSQNVRIDRNEQAIADLGYKVDNLEGKLSAGIASSVAMASMPSSFIKGEARIAGGFGYYNGENAIAIGITGATETGDYSYKLGSSYTQEGGAVVGAGISYRLW